jgi:hypothetical protein
MKIIAKKKYYDQARKTLEILMAKIGLQEVFVKLMKGYQVLVTKNLDETLIKLLYRCIIAWDSIHKCEKIFNLINKKDLLYLDFHESLNPKNLEEAEKILAKYLL